LFALSGVCHIKVSAAAIRVREADASDCATLRPATAAAIRDVLDGTGSPLGALQEADSDVVLLSVVKGVLDTQVNPSVAAQCGPPVYICAGLF